MRFFTALFAAALLAAAASAQEADERLRLLAAAVAQEGLDERLIGTWEQPESEVLSAGVEGKLQIELNDDGTVELAFEGLFNLVGVV